MRKLIGLHNIAFGLILAIVWGMVAGGSHAAQHEAALLNLQVQDSQGRARVVLSVSGALAGYDVVAGSRSLTIHLNGVRMLMESPAETSDHPLVAGWKVSPSSAPGTATDIELLLRRPITFKAKRTEQGLALMLTASANGQPPEAPSASTAPSAQAEPQPSAHSARSEDETADQQTTQAAAEQPSRDQETAAASTPPSPAPQPKTTRPTEMAQAPAAAQPEQATAQPPTSRAPKTTPDAAAEQPPADASAFHGQRISLDFHNSELTNILRAIAEVSELNIVAGDDVSGTITIRMQEVPWDQALDVILKVKGLVKQRDGNILRILTVDSLKREEEAQRAEEEAEARSRLAKAQARKAEIEAETETPLTEKLVPILYADAEEMKKNLEPFLSKDRAGEPRGFINVNTHTNTLIIRDTENNLKEIRKITKQLDQPTPQVMIEARIVEATRDFTRDLGIQWTGGFVKGKARLRGGLDPATNAAINLPAVGPTSALGFTLGNIANTRLLDIRLSALETQGKGRIITRPRIVTLDNKEAVIQRGDRIPIRVLNQQGVTSTQFVDANLNLTVTPHVTRDNFISISISVNLDEPDFGRTVDGQPTIVTRSARTEMLVKNGTTAVIGGLLQSTLADSDNQVPGISKIPIFGRLFRRNSKTEQTRELLIFITPSIIQQKS